MKRLYVVDGPDKGGTFNLNDDVTTIGRASDNDILISDRGVSRYHAKVLKKDDRVFIVDLDSLQGVFIDGEKIEPGSESEITRESNVTIGKTILSFHRESPEKEATQRYHPEAERRPFETDERVKGIPRSYTRSLELLLKVSNILAQSLNIDKLLAEVMNQIFGLFKRIDRGAILLLDEETGELQEVALKTRIDDKEDVFSKINYSRTIVNRAIKEGAPVMMSDTRRESKTELSKSMEQMRVMSVICVPLKYKDEVRGVIYVDSLGSPGGFRRDDLELLTGLSNTAAIAIENAQLYEALKQELAERKRAEEEKVTLEAQVQYARKMEALGTLASGIAHNFNNLLMGIQGYTSLMLMDIDLEHPHYKRLKGIEQQVQSGSKLTEQLLGYVREGSYEVRPISLNLVVKGTCDTFAITKKEIRVHQDLAKGLWGINADQRQIEQVLLNLYVNAADAMPSGGDLFLKTGNVTDKDMVGKPYTPKRGNYVLLTVRDTGAGMNKSTMERIFEPFFTTKGLSRGTGLGLSSAYGIIKSHGGYIDVSSKKGHGTTFSIYLPASKKEGTTQEELATEVLRGKETVLLVDDEDVIVDVGRGILESMGYKVLVAGSGKEAIKLYEKKRDKIDIVILDMVMPDTSGGTTYDRMKEINPDVKVLLSSGYAINGQASEILDRGCDGFIQKPFSVRDLSKKLREILDKK